MLQSVCVFCASSDGQDPRYGAAAIQLGEAIAKRGLTLIYGGGTSGLMGITAAACLNAGGKVHGGKHVTQTCTSARGLLPCAAASITVPDNLLSPTPADQATPDDKSIMTVVATMHERKMKMATLADAFISLPGGFGTLEELAEMTTWNQLKIHSKPSILLNVLDFYTPLRQFIQGAVDVGFISTKNQHFMLFADAGEGDNWGEVGIKMAEDWVNNGPAGEAYQLSWA